MSPSQMACAGYCKSLALISQRSSGFLGSIRPAGIVADTRDGECLYFDSWGGVGRTGTVLAAGWCSMRVRGTHPSPDFRVVADC